LLKHGAGVAAKAANQGIAGGEQSRMKASLLLAHDGVASAKRFASRAL